MPQFSASYTLSFIHGLYSVHRLLKETIYIRYGVRLALNTIVRKGTRFSRMVFDQQSEKVHTKARNDNVSIQSILIAHSRRTYHYYIQVELPRMGLD